MMARAHSSQRYGSMSCVCNSTVLLRVAPGYFFLQRKGKVSRHNTFRVDSVVEGYGAEYPISRTTHQPSDHVMV
jgi:hypothetical protein